MLLRGAGGPRRRGRELLFRLLYQAEMTRDSVAQSWRATREEERLPDEALEYVDALVETIEESLPAVDERIRTVAEHWKFDRIAATDRSILRLAAAELLFMPGTPARVVIDEAVEIAKKYGREESGRFVNGILDRIARDARPGELDEAPTGRGARGPDDGDRGDRGDRS
jgi:N utilization substance protein B